MNLISFGKFGYLAHILVTGIVNTPDYTFQV